ncbi:MAG: hypothetical protein ACRC5S_12445 [Cetobacterium sp.]
MDIEKAIQGLKELGIWSVDEAEYTRVAKMRTLLFSKYNIEYSLKDIRDYLKLKDNLAEISNNFFVLKSALEEILKEKSRKEYKEILEKKYAVQIEEDKILNIHLESTKYSFEDVLNYGLENSFVEQNMLKNLEIEESDFIDIYEVIDVLEKRGIEIK